MLGLGMDLDYDLDYVMCMRDGRALRMHAMLINSISDFRHAMRHGPYAWPGGYPCYFVTDDGEALSFEAARQERRNILEAIRDGLHDGWRIVGMDINYEDSELRCAHTGKRIESAYAHD
jgi:hypothetical protein